MIPNKYILFNEVGVFYNFSNVLEISRTIQVIKQTGELFHP
jgi:hypothetical protein